jgi:hypothetical protein
MDQDQTRTEQPADQPQPDAPVATAPSMPPTPAITPNAPGGTEAGTLAMQMLAQLQTQASQIGQLWQQTQQQWIEIETRAARLAADREALDRDLEALESFRQDFDRRAAEVAQKADAAERALAEVESKRAIESAREHALAQREAELLRREQETDQHRQASEQRQREAEARASEAQTREAEAQAREAEARAREAEAQQREAEAQSRADELQSRLTDAEARLAQAASAPAPQAAPTPDPATAQELDETRRQLAQREDALRVLAERLLRAEENAIQRQAELEQARAALEARPEKPDPFMHTPEDRGAPVNSEEAFASALRRSRLKRYKQLLSAQSRKVLRAKDALVKRQAECEQVLAQRAALVEKAATLNSREADLAARAARSGGAIIGVCAAAMLALVCGLAWTVAGKAAPARFAATAVLAAQTPDREPAEGELEAWGESYEELLRDPAVVQEAAQQFSRRAMTELATPPAVQQRVEADLYAHSPQPGKLAIEWRGTGSERSARELETYLAAAVSVAETRRHARGDGALTIIAQAPSAGSEPLDGSRVRYAAGFAVLGVVLTVAASLGGYALIRRQQASLRREESALARA